MSIGSKMSIQHNSEDFRLLFERDEGAFVKDLRMDIRFPGVGGEQRHLGFLWRDLKVLLFSPGHVVDHISVEVCFDGLQV